MNDDNFDRTLIIILIVLAIIMIISSIILYKNFYCFSVSISTFLMAVSLFRYNEYAIQQNKVINDQGRVIKTLMDALNDYIAENNKLKNEKRCK